MISWEFLVDLFEAIGRDHRLSFQREGTRERESGGDDVDGISLCEMPQSKTNTEKKRAEEHAPSLTLARAHSGDERRRKETREAACREVHFGWWAAHRVLLTHTLLSFFLFLIRIQSLSLWTISSSNGCLLSPQIDQKRRRTTRLSVCLSPSNCGHNLFAMIIQFDNQFLLCLLSCGDFFNLVQSSRYLRRSTHRTELEFVERSSRHSISDVRLRPQPHDDDEETQRTDSLTRWPSKQFMIWWAQTHWWQRKLEHSKHFATAIDSEVLQAVQYCVHDSPPNANM